MTKSPLVSFVVPCYNTQPYAAECLHSIFEQTADYPFEVIALDDCSGDGTQDVLRSFTDRRLRLILHSKNEGFIRTISEGLLEAQGQFVARIDSDDRYRPEFLSLTVPHLLRHPEVGLVYGGAAIIGPDSQVQSSDWDRIHFGGDAKENEFVALLHRNYLCAPTVIARRELWHSTLPVPSHLAFTDWYHNLFIARQCEFYYVDQILADYRVHPGNLHARMFKNGGEEATIRYILGRLFSEVELDPALEQAKQRARKSVYAAQLLVLAEKYFGAAMTLDARRCYREAFRCQPSQILTPGLLRRFLATFLDRSLYDFLKTATRPSRPGV